jgi:protein-S-isoprenylcysteine O-methyltransferase Ste14
MILMIMIGVVVLVVGKLKLTRSLVLVGKRARMYGLALIITAIPFALIVGGLIAVMIPESILAHPAWGRIINYTLLISYLVLLALPFREREKHEAPSELRLPNQPP